MSETAIGTDDEKSTEPLQLVGSVENRHDHVKNDRQSGKPVAAKSSKNRDRLSKRWQCPACSFVNSCRHRRCIMCEFDSYLQPQLNDSSAVDEEEDRKEPANPSLSGEDSLVGPEDELWRCAKCTFKNKHKSRYCEICGVKNETGKPATATASKDPTTTDAVAAGSSSIEKRKRPQSKTDTELGVVVDEKSLSDAVVVEQPPAVEQEASNSDDDEAKPADVPPVDVGEASKDSIEQPVSGPHPTGGDAAVVDHVNESSVVSEDVKPATKEPVKKGNPCPLCTFNNPREYRYCDMCGTQLEQAVPSRSVKTPSTVRRSTDSSKPAAAVDVKTEAVDEGNGHRHHRGCHLHDDACVANEATTADPSGTQTLRRDVVATCCWRCTSRRRRPWRRRCRVLKPPAAAQTVASSRLIHRSSDGGGGAPSSAALQTPPRQPPRSLRCRSGVCPMIDALKGIVEKVRREDATKFTANNE